VYDILQAFKNTIAAVKKDFYIFSLL